MGIVIGSILIIMSFFPGFSILYIPAIVIGIVIIIYSIAKNWMAPENPIDKFDKNKHGLRYWLLVILVGIFLSLLLFLFFRIEG